MEKNLQHRTKFIIDSIDPLGQGVAKNSDKITFIDKVLPAETGEAVIWRENAKVRFAKLLSLESENLSSLRQKPECVHFESCYNCAYLHTNYAYEIVCKKNAFSRMLKPFAFENNIESIEATSRLHYRNRMQLHYDLKNNVLGYNNPVENKLIEVPLCQLPRAELQSAFDELYRDQNWKKKIPKSEPETGHIEIYFRNGLVEININKPYAHGGFTQVNEEMNSSLKNYLLTIFSKYQPKHILDVFGGAGNLTNHYEKAKVSVVDNSDIATSQLKPWQNYTRVNLYDAKEWKPWLKKIKDVDFLLVDPPRTGMKQLSEVVTTLNPLQICYVSCNPNTMVRDLRELKNYKMVNAVVIDLFPSTHHFEALVVLEQK